MKIKLLLTSWWLVLQVNLPGQITFQKTYDRDSTYQFGLSVKQCFDGGYILTGYTDPANTLLIRTNQFGDTLWTRSYGDIGECGFDVIQTADSNFVISGYYSPTNSRTHLIKVDDQGNTTWSHMLCSGWGQSVQETFDRGLIIAGAILLKTDSLGITQWCKDLDFQAMYIIQVMDSSYIISGSSSSTSEGLMYLEKRDQNGVKIWTKTFAGSHFGISNNILAKTNDGGYILAARNIVNGESLLIKTDADGDSLWTREYPGFIGTSLIQTRDGGFAIGGYYTSTNEKTILLKTNANGFTQWGKYFGFAHKDIANSIQQTSDGGFILTGKTARTITSDYDAFLIKTDSLGNILATSISNVEPIQNISIHPNPFSSSTTIQISSVLTDADLIMYNSYGQMVRTMTHIFSNEIEINREHLPPGLYYICITQDHQLIASTKVVIAE